MNKPSRNYSYFDYVLPSRQAKDYAEQALKVLRQIKEQFPEFYTSFSCPSEVLTISGVRAFDTYYELGKNVSRITVNSLKALLAKHGIALIEENFPFGNENFPENRYSLVHIAALNDIPNRYRNMPEPGWVQPDFAKLKQDNDFFLWWGNWQRSILLVRELDPVCKNWLANNSGIAHDMTFGMLLGYPGEAISSVLYETVADSETDQIIHSKVKHADAFDGAHPTYTYMREVAHNANIDDHQRLWADILDGVYSKLEK